MVGKTCSVPSVVPVGYLSHEACPRQDFTLWLLFIVEMLL
jgi:hypothetical protein